MKPNSKHKNSDTEYLHELIDKIGLSQRAAARLIGVNESTLRSYLNPNHDSICPYPVQYCLEVLAGVEYKDESN